MYVGIAMDLWGRRRGYAIENATEESEIVWDPHPELFRFVYGFSEQLRKPNSFFSRSPAVQMFSCSRRVFVYLEVLHWLLSSEKQSVNNLY